MFEILTKSFLKITKAKKKNKSNILKRNKKKWEKKWEKKLKKKLNIDDVKFNYLSNIPQDDNLADLPILIKPFPWSEVIPDGSSAEVMEEYWNTLMTRLREN